MIHYNKVILHNFGPYTHTEVDLQNKGFCLVTGENHRTKDNAKSNGSGKSFIWSGICFAITGETIQGIKTKLKNKYNDDTDAYVSLDFIYDKDHYFLTRIIAPKSDLKIEKNGIDVSGKGIRESEEKLKDLLPDLTQDLIASTTIIGQGMPNKFSAFKPSGRKELLEKLTKSDFMIEDIKKRISDRQVFLGEKLREIEDELLVLKTQISTAEATLNSKNLELSTAVKPDFDTELINLDNQLKNIEADLTAANANLVTQEALVESLTAELNTLTADKAKMSTTLLENYTTKVSPLNTKKITLETQIRTLDGQIRKLLANPEICPTCGQKIQGTEHFKQEAANKEKEKAELQIELDTVISDIAEADKKNVAFKQTINDKFDADIKAKSSDVATAKSNLTKIKHDISDFTQYYNEDKIKKTQLEAKKDSWDKEQANLKNAILTLTELLNDGKKTQKELLESKSEYLEHSAVVKQLDTLTKRDFRGYILTDIIKYLDTKAKYYANIVFGHTDFELCLDGNDLNISYDDRSFDNLSGGEKTRVDLIIQFAIRDLLTTYLNASSNIIVLDEVTDFLDSQACDALMSLINSELKDVESVFIVSHHAEELNLPIDSEIKVVKSADGTSSLA